MNYSFDLNSTLFMRECTGQDFYTAECLHKYFCPQLSSYFVKAGIFIVVLYIVMGWLLWWFFNHGFKLWSYNPKNRFDRFIGDLKLKENRIYWDSWIRSRLNKLMLGYIVVVIYFNI